MNTKIISTTVVIFCLSMAAIAQVKTDSSQTIKNDTTKIKIGNTSILIIEGKGNEKTEIRVEKDDETTNGYTSKSKPAKDKKAEVHWSGIEMGVTLLTDKDMNFDTPAGFDFLELNEAKSIAVNINFLEKNVNLAANKLHFVTGLGFGINNYRFRKDITLVPDSNYLTATYDSIDYKKNKLTVTYLTAPFLLEYVATENSKKTFHMATGVVAGLRIGSHTKQKYDTGKSSLKPKVRDDFNLSPVKLDATVRMGVGGLNLFANYSLNSLFRNKQGPEVHPLTVGIGLVGF